ncbi:MAG: hypothetical protein GY778_05840 [bacterium]|nr:hypothetical protein [bacterium]
MNRTTDSAKSTAPPTALGHRRALTLVELLAATATVALLVAVLTPAVAGVRSRSKQTVCLQNLGRIAEASIVYATADPDDQAIPVHPRMNYAGYPPELRRQISRMAWGGKSGRGVEDYDPYFWGTHNHMGPSTRPLNRILYGDVFPDYAANPGPNGINWDNDARLDLKFNRCPSDNGHTGDPVNTSWRDGRLTSYDHYGNSYAANVIWIFVPGGSDCWGSSCCDSNSPLLHRLADIGNPAQTLYYLESCGRSAFFAEPQGTQDSCGGSTGEIDGWHGQPWQFNVAFVDGHAGTVNIRGHQNPRLGHYPECGGWSNCHQFWHCVIIRGDDWQMDTLPLEPVRSTIPCS